MSDDEDFDIDFNEDDADVDVDADEDVDAEVNEEANEDDNEYVEEEQELIAERKAFERVGVSMASTAKTPKEKFKNVVSSIFYKLKTQLNFSDTDLTNILDPVDKISKIQYKNQTAYILGYYVTKGGRDKLINTRSMVDRLDRAESAIDDSDPSITRADIIRYSVFWNEIKK